MKKKLLALVALSMAASLWFVSAGTSSADHVTVTISFATVQTCYDVDDGDDVATDVRLITKTYGKDDVQVRQLVMMCELSKMGYFEVVGGGIVTPLPPSVADTTIFACYELRSGQDPNDPITLDTPSFGTDSVVVGRSNLMCESAKKHVYNRDGSVSTFGVGTNTIMQCFDLAKGKDPALKTYVTNNNFGRESIQVRTAVQMCEEGEKHRKQPWGLEVTGMANGVVSECFRVRGGDDQLKPVVLETDNFGRDKVVVRRAVQVCQLAEKVNFNVIQAVPVEP